MSLNDSDISTQLRASLQEAVVKCSERCLYQSAKWAAELLNAIPEPSEQPGLTEATAIPTTLSHNSDPREALLEAKEINKYLLAKTFFDCREYDRCAAIFLPDSLLSGLPSSTQPPTSAATSGGKGKSKSLGDSGISLPEISQKSLFLALYAKFMSGEKRKDEDCEMVMGPQDQGGVINKQLIAISRILSAWFNDQSTEEDEKPESQGWLEYLYGMVLAREKNDAKALKFLLRSVHKFPMNWGCWLEITMLITRVEEMNSVLEQLPHNITSYFFHLHTSLELYQQGAHLVKYLKQLLDIFPTSAFLLTCNALLSYHAKEFIVAEHHFSQLLALHPRRLDSLDHYSNILYVMGRRPKLAYLAHLCSSVDKFRPESCVVIGNYYSLLSMHEKAVQYFRRALTLDKSCLSAWTLMGHEYVELKNTHAAIESYRRAVDVNRRDYRAWYGLGQTYEMLEMHTYSLWYYKKACGLRPWDGKMWQAVGSCLQRMQRYHDSINALKRALMADSYYNSNNSNNNSSTATDSDGGGAVFGYMDPDILLQIAIMYEELGDEEEAKSYMELCVAQEDGGHENAADMNLGESMVIHNDSPGGSSDDENDGSSGRAKRSGGGAGSGEGTGVTAATSTARKWLAKHAMQEEDFETAHQLAIELCQDGVEMEDAKALIREVRSRMEAAGIPGPSR